MGWDVIGCDGLGKPLEVDGGSLRLMAPNFLRQGRGAGVGAGVGARVGAGPWRDAIG